MRQITWPQLHIGTVIRQLSHGTLKQALMLLHRMCLHQLM